MPDKNIAVARCPECDSRLYFERRLDVGEVIVCPECETSLEVLSTNPLRLDWAYDEGGGTGASAFAREDLFDDFDDDEDGFDDDYEEDED